MNGRANHIIRIVPLVLASMCALSRAAVYHVSPDGDNTTGESWTTAFTSIQTAIDHAVAPSGDVVRVRYGTYTITAPITVTRPILVYGGYTGVGETRNPAAYGSLVQGGGNVLHCLHITASATIDGLWITGGRAVGDAPDGEGGAMYIDACDPIINDCTFQDNYAALNGGAIRARSSHLGVISDCSFVQNVTGDQGGAIHADDCDLTITRCSFTQNKGLTGSTTRGGAIYHKNSAPTITDCLFSGNGATKGGGLYNAGTYATIAGCTFAGCSLGVNEGGAIYHYQSSSTVTNCLFSGNEVSGRGGAIYEGSASGGSFVNCVVRNNRAASQGGGIYASGSTTRFLNCTIYGNRADSRGGGLYNDYGEPIFTNCIFWGNIAVTDGAGICDYATTPGYKALVRYSDVQGSAPYPGTGNILADPKFVNPGAANLHLGPGSGCIDVGNSSVLGLPLEDFDGNPRVVDGDLNGSAIVDMGAYEYQASHGVADHLWQISTFQAYVYDSPSDPTPHYVFLMEFETDGSVEHIAFLTPAGEAYVIPNDPFTSSGDIRTYHEVRGTTHVWGHWGQFASKAGLLNYGDGMYTIAVHYPNGSTHQTTVQYNVPQTGLAVLQPTQKPQLTAPAYGAQITSPVTVTWNACTDPNMSSTGARVYLTVSDRDTSSTMVSTAMAIHATQSDAYGLNEGWYDLELACENFYQVTNLDGVGVDYGKAALVQSEFEVIHTTMYRFWSSRTGRHFYTIQESEKNKLIHNYPHVWKYEGAVFKACATPYHPGLVQVHRFWSASSSAHFYTIMEHEKNKLIEKYAHVWTHEGPAFYAYPEGAQPPQAKPVYRFWKAVNNTHFYTLSESEKQKLLADYAGVYFYEGIAFYAYE